MTVDKTLLCMYFVSAVTTVNVFVSAMVCIGPRCQTLQSPHYLLLLTHVAVWKGVSLQTQKVFTSQQHSHIKHQLYLICSFKHILLFFN